jgi:Outer membrane lipoprotein carrier protein LolA-like
MTSGPAPGRRAERLLLVLAIVLMPVAGTRASAQDSGPQSDGAEWGVQQLMRELGAVKRSQSRFVERKYLKVLKAPLELRGTLTYVAPGNLVKRTLSPKLETLTVEGDRLTLASAARNGSRTLRLRDYPVLWAFVESIRSTLSGDIAALERFYRVELEGGRARWRLYLVPRDSDMRAVISLINIGGSRDRVERIEVQETRGDRSVTTIVEESR